MAHHAAKYDDAARDRSNAADVRLYDGRLGEALRDALQFFYPNGSWAGYAKFFEPNIPDRIGGPLLQHIHKGLSDLCETSINHAIDLLKSAHVKQPPGVACVICEPTSEATRAIALLLSIKIELGIEANIDRVTRPGFEPGSNEGLTGRELRRKFIAERMLPAGDSIRVVAIGTFTPHKGFEGKFCPLPEYGIGLLIEG